MPRTTMTTSVDFIQQRESRLVQWRWRNLWETPSLALVGFEAYKFVQPHSVILARVLVVMLIIAAIGSLHQSAEGWMIWMRRRCQRDTEQSSDHEAEKHSAVGFWHHYRS